MLDLIMVGKKVVIVRCVLEELLIVMGCGKDRVLLVI